MAKSIFIDRLKFTFNHSFSAFIQSASPFKSISFYRQYFAAAEAVAVQRNRNSIALFKVYLLLFAYFIALNCLVFPLFPLSPSSRILLADGVFILMLKDRQFYFIYAGIATYTVLLYWSMYFAYNRPLNEVLKRAFTEKGILEAETGLQLPLTGTQVTFRQVIRLTVHSLQVFTLIIDVCGPVFMLMAGGAFVDCYLPNFSSSHPLWTTLFFLLFPLHLLHVALNCLVWFAFGHVLILVGVNFTVGLTFIVLQFRENNGQLREELKRGKQKMEMENCGSSTVKGKPASHHHRFLLFTLLRRNLSHFRLVFLFDDFYGKQTLVFFALHGPLSAYFMSQVLFGHIDVLPMTIMVGVSLEAYVGSLLLHLYMAHYSGYIHRAGRMLLSYSAATSATSESFTPTKDRLLLSTHIQRLVVRRRYGVTYGGKWSAWILLVLCKFL